MRKFNTLTIAIVAALALAGCAEGIAAVGSQSAGLHPVAPSKPASVSSAPPVKLAEEQRRDAICAWAKRLSMDKLTVGPIDAGKTKRQIAALDGAYKATCAADVKVPNPATASATDAPKK